MKIVYFIRHGEATHNVEARDIGEDAYFKECHRDAKLTDIGKQQAQNVERPEVDVVITSPLTRTLETTCHIFDVVKTNVIASDIVRETNNTHLCNNRNKKSILQSDNVFIDFSSLTEDDEWWAVGETCCRKEALDRLIEEQTHDKIAIVSHGSFISDYLGYKGYPNIYLDNCEILKCSYENRTLNISKHDC